MAAGKSGLKTAPEKVEQAEGVLQRLGDAINSQWGAQPMGCTAGGVHIWRDAQPSLSTRDLSGSDEV